MPALRSWAETVVAITEEYLFADDMMIPLRFDVYNTKKLRQVNITTIDCGNVASWATFELGSSPASCSGLRAVNKSLPSRE